MASRNSNDARLYVATWAIFSGALVSPGRFWHTRYSSRLEKLGWLVQRNYGRENRGSVQPVPMNLLGAD